MKGGAVMKKNLLIIHGGAPTAVLNCSLYGVIKEAKKYSEIEKIYGANAGSGGVLQGNLLDLTDIADACLENLRHTPGTAIGTSRDALEYEDYEKIAERLQQYNIGWVLCNGGNGTMDTCGKIQQVCKQKSMDIRVIGIPKTMDNDIAITDHSPGFASAAQYMAASTAELIADVESLPLHIVILEAMGRNAGWVAASSCFAEEYGVSAPDLIYLPEVPFYQEQFLQDVKRLIDRKGYGVIVVSEGLRTATNQPIVPPAFQVGRAVYFGDICTHLANTITQRLNYKTRAEKPGILGRASIACQSEVDRQEAEQAGRTAVQAAIAGHTAKMVAFKRVSDIPYQSNPYLVDIQQVMLYEKTLPSEFINEQGNGVTRQFKDWCRPLLSFPDKKMESAIAWKQKFAIKNQTRR